MDTGDQVFDWLDAEADKRAHAGLTRRLRPRPATSDELDLAGNDYLGLAREKRVAGAAAAAALRWGAGATGSRLVTGSLELHAELEYELARFCGFPAALVFSSGFTANLGAITALARSFSIQARSWNVIRLSAGPPTRRAWSSIALKSSPWLPVTAIVSPVTALCTSASPPEAACHWSCA